MEWIYDNRSIAVKNEGKITVDGKSVHLSVEPSHDGKTLFLFGSRLDDNSDYVFSVAVKNIPDEYFNAFD